MKFDNAMTPRARTLSPISILETCIDVYKRLFAKVNIRLVNAYKLFGIELPNHYQYVLNFVTIAD